MRTVSAYKASDGTLFDDRDECKLYEYRQQVTKLLNCDEDNGFDPKEEMDILEKLIRKDTSLFRDYVSLLATMYPHAEPEKPPEMVSVYEEDGVTPPRNPRHIRGDKSEDNYGVSA